MLKTRQFRPQLEQLGERINPTSPHFISASSALGSAGELTASFKEAGLGDNVTITVELSTDANAQYTAINKGGNKPQGQPFQVPPITLTASGDFSSGKNGNVVGSLTIQPPPPPQDFLDAVKSPNWVAQLDVSYQNVTLTDMTNGVSVGLASQSGTFIVKA